MPKPKTFLKEAKPKKKTAKQVSYHPLIGNDNSLINLPSRLRSQPMTILLVRIVLDQPSNWDTKVLSNELQRVLS